MKKSLGKQTASKQIQKNNVLQLTKFIEIFSIYLHTIDAKKLKTDT